MNTTVFLKEMTWPEVQQAIQEQPRLNLYRGYNRAAWAALAAGRGCILAHDDC